MEKIRTYTSKIILFVVALQILNLSVYGSEFKQALKGKNGRVAMTTNQIDCMIEYVVEEVVTHRDVFPEQKGNHTKNETKTLKTPIQWVAQNHSFAVAEKTLYNEKIYPPYKEHYKYLFFKEINPPPPKQSFSVFSSFSYRKRIS